MLSITSTNLAILGTTLFGVFAFYFIIKPIVEYFYDAKRLRQYPNQNFLSGFTNLGYIYERLAAFRTANLNEAHKEHPIIRLGPNALSFGDVRAIKDIYGHSTTCSKGDMYWVAAGAHSNLLDVVDKGEHARKRRLVSHAFATRNLENWEYKVADKTERLIRQFDIACGVAEKAGERFAQIDYRKWSNLFTVEAIADIGLSYRMGMLERGNDLMTVERSDGTHREYGFIESLHGGNRATSIIVWPTAWFTIIRNITKLTSGWFRSQWQHGNNYGDIIKHMTRIRLERHEKGERLDDFFQFLMEDRGGVPHNLDIGEVEAEVNVIMNAGSDTTAIQLTHVMYFLLKNRSNLEKLREEVDSALAPDDIVAPYATIRHLPYLRACLDESLRMAPPVSFGLARKTPPEGAAILGQWIAGDITVSIPAYIAHRDPTIFQEPAAYRPERWLDEKAKEMQPYFIPFSMGARGCIGRNISYLEQHVLLASLVKRYDFELADEQYELPREEAFNLWPGPLPVKVRRR
ncbi:cytochrome P450 [Rhizodiscina lignyota]|uniref:Cytochrome P450 n=1 Tax=Rhizodiscina lignyota TaxID=1504668 RepID=A0A9P4IFW3_9PEZI|nr:cytochrome P450 [Rhizodiscina lignyota]